MPLSVPQEKKQQYLAFILLILIVIGAFWFLWPKIKSNIPPPPPIPEAKKIEINFGVLTNTAIKELTPFEEISPLKEGIGRENPFSPYPKIEIPKSEPES